MRTSVSFHPSVILWLSVLGYVQPGILLPFLLSALLHECGHFLCLLSMQRPPIRVTFRLSGASMETPSLSYRQELLAAAAGPLTSLLLGLTIPVWPMLGGYSLCLGLFNLLPLFGLDGGRMLRCFLLLHLPEHRAFQLLRITYLLTGSMLLLPGLYGTFRLGLGLWPLLLCAVLAIRAVFQGLQADSHEESGFLL